MEAVIETKLLEPIVIPIREAQLVQMSKYVKCFSDKNSAVFNIHPWIKKVESARFSMVALQGRAEGADCSKKEENADGEGC